VKIRSHYPLLAELFEYPYAGYAQRVRQVTQVLSEHYCEAGAELDQFQKVLPKRGLHTLQELFTRSFDVQAITTLDVGYVLFGDDYKRGELLANLNREHREAGNNCGHELADHLPNILRLIGKLRDKELVEELVQEILAPALRQMIGEFSPERIQKKNESYVKHYKTLIASPETEVVTLYQFALKALYEVLKQDFMLTERNPPESTSDFLRSVGRENDIEERVGAHY
jgi:nitrate reductase assembly molybdenum cofactor insertion protein NarJ